MVIKNTTSPVVTLGALVRLLAFVPLHVVQEVVAVLSGKPTARHVTLQHVGKVSAPVLVVVVLKEGG